MRQLRPGNGESDKSWSLCLLRSAKVPKSGVGCKKRNASVWRFGTSGVDAMSDKRTREVLLTWLDENGVNGNPTEDHDSQCKSLFCHYESEITVYSENYEKEIDVCSVCVAEKLGVREIPERRKMLGEKAKESLDNEPLPYEIISDVSAADLGVEER